MLFDGKDLSAWENGDKWKVEDGVAIVAATATSRPSRASATASCTSNGRRPVPATGSSQGRGNSGVFLMDRYELQVLDSYDNETYFDGQAGAIYKQTPPMVNAMRPPGEWNTYDIIWTAPQFKDDGSLEVAGVHHGAAQRRADAQSLRSCRATRRSTEPPQYEKHGKLPIHLQDHGNPVRFRNIWVREIKPIVGKRVREPYFRDGDREMAGGEEDDCRGAPNQLRRPVPAIDKNSYRKSAHFAVPIINDQLVVVPDPPVAELTEYGFLHPVLRTPVPQSAISDSE